MRPQTLDVYPDEMLLMALMLGQLIHQQNEKLRIGGVDSNEAEQIRTRIEIATRLRAKLPLSIHHDEPNP